MILPVLDFFLFLVLWSRGWVFFNDLPSLQDKKNNRGLAPSRSPPSTVFMSLKGERRFDLVVASVVFCFGYPGFCSEPGRRNSGADALCKVMRYLNLRAKWLLSGSRRDCRSSSRDANREGGFPERGRAQETEVFDIYVPSIKPPGLSPIVPRDGSSGWRN